MTASTGQPRLITPMPTAAAAPAATGYNPHLTPAPTVGSLPMLVGAQKGDRYVGAHPVTSGNGAQLLVDTKMFVPRVMQDIEGAKDHINATMFSWQDDGAGFQIGEALKQKAREGVDVNVVIDAIGSRHWPMSRHKKYVDSMRDAGVHVQSNWRYDIPLLPDHNDGVRAVDHRKIFEIDGKVAYLGGMNLAKKYDEWHDTMVRLEGPVAAQAGAEVLGRFVDTGGKVLPRTQQSLAKSVQAAEGAKPVGTAQVRLVGNSPKVELAATQEFYDLADKATRRFWVLSPYLGDDRMIGKLVETAKRGVDVRLAVPGPNPWKNGKFALKLTRSFYPQLVGGGVKVFEQPQMSHSKLWLSDDIANISSVNLDNHSSKMDYEIGATVQDPAFLGQVEQLFARDFGRSRPIGLQEANTHRNMERARKFIGLDV